MFATGDTLNCSCGGLGEETSDLRSLRAARGWGSWLLPQVPRLRAQRCVALHHGVCSHLQWTNWWWVRITAPYSYPALVMLGTLGTPSSSLLGSQEVDCLGISSSEGRHASTCSENCQSGGCGSSSPAQGLNSQEADLPPPSWNLISKRLSHPSLPGDLHPDLGTPGSQVATILGRISFRKTHP